jgi:hypothetical protein
MKYIRLSVLIPLALAASGLPVDSALASSHREAPDIAGRPRVDGTDFYMFRSYEPGRDGFVTFMANYIPFQTSLGAVVYYKPDATALYEILINNDGQAVENMTFQFRFTNTLTGVGVPVDNIANQPIALSNVGPFGRNGDPNDTANLSSLTTYTIDLIRGPRHFGFREPVTNAATGSPIFTKPEDNIGTRSAPDYAAYAAAQIFPIKIPGCATPGRVFVGQRADPFNVSLGQGFDLLNFATITHPATTTTDQLVSANTPTPFVPAGEANANAGVNTNRNQAIMSIEMEVPIACLTNQTNGDPVIGAWTDAELPRNQVIGATPDFREIGGDFRVVSRDSMALVNELVIGLPFKDRFNASEPVDDAQFASFVEFPSFPTVIETLLGPKGEFSQFGYQAPTLAPRADLVATFLTGLKGINQPISVKPAEMLRLNTSTAPTPAANQNPLGVIGGDSAGYPNGRRPGDDSVDITLRVAMGRLITLGLFGTNGSNGTVNQAPSGNVDFTQGARQSAADFDTTFPYLRPPFPGNLATVGN